MPRTKEANDLLRKQRCDLILSIALRLICLEGYENVTMDKIANEAKISHGLIYHYFKNKATILGKLIEIGKEKFTEIVPKGFPESDSKVQGRLYYERLTNFVFNCLKRGEEYPYYLYLFLSFRLNIHDYQEYSHLAFFKEFEANFLYAQKNGDFEEGDVKDYLTCYFTLLRSIVYQLISSKGRMYIPSEKVVMNLFYKKKEGLNTDENII